MKQSATGRLTVSATDFDCKATRKARKKCLGFVIMVVIVLVTVVVVRRNSNAVGAGVTVRY